MGRIGIWLRNLAIIAVLATFAFLFGQPQGTDPASAPVAEVNSETIPRDVYEFFREQNQQAFSQFGAVTSAKVMMERDTGRSKGFGFVEMGSDAEAQAAINGMNGQSLGGA